MKIFVLKINVLRGNQNKHEKKIQKDLERMGSIPYFCFIKQKQNTMASTKQKWYWVLGDTTKGFKIVDKRPRTKFVPEPFEKLESAKRWIAMQFWENA